MAFLKLNVNEQKSAEVKSPAARDQEGKFGLQKLYDFIIDGEDYTLSVSPTSAVVTDMQGFSSGQKVIIKRVPTSGGRSTYKVVDARDISNLPHNQNLPSGAEAFREWVETPTNEYGVPMGVPSQEEVRESKYVDTSFAIAVQSARKDAALFLAEKPDAKSEDVLDVADKFLDWYKRKIS